MSADHVTIAVVVFGAIAWAGVNIWDAMRTPRQPKIDRRERRRR